MTNKQKIKKALNFLQTAYFSQIIGYSRVDNSYKTDNNGLDMFPHPSLPYQLSRSFKPFQKRKGIRVTSDELILFLSTTHTISPSQIEGVYDYIDYYLDDDLLPRTDALKVEAELVISLLEQFMTENEISKKEIYSNRKTLFTDAYQKNDEAILYEQSNVYFFSEKESKKAMSGRWKASKNAKANKDAPYGGVTKIRSIREALDIFDASQKDPSPAEKTRAMQEEKVILTDNAQKRNPQ